MVCAGVWLPVWPALIGMLDQVWAFNKENVEPVYLLPVPPSEALRIALPSRNEQRSKPHAVRYTYTPQAGRVCIQHTHEAPIVAFACDGIEISQVSDSQS